MNQVNLQSRCDIHDIGRTQGLLCEFNNDTHPDLRSKSPLPRGEFLFYSERKNLSVKLKSISIVKLGRVSIIKLGRMQYVPTVLNVRKLSRMKAVLSRTETEQTRTENILSRIETEQTRMENILSRTEIEQTRMEAILSRIEIKQASMRFIRTRTENILSKTEIKLTRTKVKLTRMRAILDNNLTNRVNIQIYPYYYINQSNKYIIFKSINGGNYECKL